MYVVLCLASENETQSDRMPLDVEDIVNSYHLTPFITEVNKYAALSKEEWEEQCKLWPTSYHPPTYNNTGITGFSEEDSKAVFNFMKSTVELAKSGDHLTKDYKEILRVDQQKRKESLHLCRMNWRSYKTHTYLLCLASLKWMLFLCLAH